MTTPSRPGLRDTRQVTSRRHEGDVLVLGYSLEAAITAVLLARRGCKLVWLGGPEATVAAGPHRILAGPSLVPSLGHAPTLARVLRDAGLLVEVQRLQRAVSLQLLGERRRISLTSDWLKAPQGEAGLQALQEMAGVASELSATPPVIGFWGQRAFRKVRSGIDARLAAPAGIVGEAAAALDDVFARTERSLGAILQTTAAPSELPGGTLVLGQMLQRKCGQLGARLFPDGLNQRMDELQVRWGGVEGRLATGEAILAKAIIVALDDAALAKILPENSPLHRWALPTGTPLLRVSFIVRRRGLPQALGTMAIMERPAPHWIERRPLNDELDACSIFWRDDGSDRAGQISRAHEVLARIAPFYEEHVTLECPVGVVADHDRIASGGRILLARRAIAARGPILEFDGAEGAALAGTALADRVLKMRVNRNASVGAR